MTSATQRIHPPTTHQHWAAKALAFEAAILHHALFSWRSQPAATSEDGFSHYRRALYGPVCTGFVLVILLELIPVHILLDLWSPTAAWIATGLGLYSLIWLIGDYRALVTRTTTVTADTLELRVGLRWTASIPLSTIRRVRRLSPHRAEPLEGALKAVILGTPRLLLELSRPVSVLGVYGMRKETDRIALTVDDEERFVEALGRPQA